MHTHQKPSIIQRNHFINLSFITFLLVGQPLYSSQAFTNVDDTTATTLPNDSNNTTYMLDHPPKVCDDFLRDNLVVQYYARGNTFFIPQDIQTLITQFRIGACVLVSIDNDKACLIHGNAPMPMVSNGSLKMYHLEKKKNLCNVETCISKHVLSRVSEMAKLFSSKEAISSFEKFYFESQFILKKKIRIIERSPDQTLITVGYNDGSVKIFDLYDINNPYVLLGENEQLIHFFEWSHDSQYLAIARGHTKHEMSIWNIPQKRCIKKENKDIGFGMHWSYDGKSLFYLSGDLFRIPLFEETLSSDSIKITFPKNGSFFSFQCSLKNKKLAIIYLDKDQKEKKKLLIYDYESEKIDFVPTRDLNIPLAYWFGKEVIYYDCKSVRKLDSETMEIVEILTDKEGLICFIELSEDGYLSVRTPTSLQLWDLNTLQHLKTFEPLNTQAIAQWRGKRLFCKVGHENNLCVIENIRGHWTLTQTDIKNPGIYG